MNTTGQITIRAWLALPPTERRERAAAFREADQALQANSIAQHAAGIDYETETYLVLNRRVNELWPTVPWWIRAPALPHPGTRTLAALYALAAAITVIAVCRFAVYLGTH